MRQYAEQEIQAYAQSVGKPMVLVDLRVQKTSRAICFKPALQEAESFILNGVGQIATSISGMDALESELVPFQDKPRRSSFLVGDESELIKTSKVGIQDQTAESIRQSDEVLNQYMKYQYILHTSRKAKILELFGSEGKSLEAIRQELQHYDQAHYEIMTLTANEVDCGIFRVSSKKLKQELGSAALAIKNKILEKTYEFCMTQLQNTYKSYSELETELIKNPRDELEFTKLRECAESAPSTVKANVQTLVEISKFFDMLDEFSFRYKELDIESFWFMKVWPLKISRCVASAYETISDKMEIFQTKLAMEKENFNQEIATFQDRFERIKQFDSLERSQEFATSAYQLNEDLITALEFKTTLNQREAVFHSEITEYSLLDNIIRDFKPFYDLTQMAYQTQCNFKDWTIEPLERCNHIQISSSIDGWLESCQGIGQEIGAAYPEAGRLCDSLGEIIMDFKQNLNLIRCLGNPDVKEEDWVQMCRVVDKDLMQSELVISDFKRLDLFQFEDQI